MSEEINNKMCEVMDHLFQRRCFKEFSPCELKRIPLEYLIDRVKPVELLEIWCNLPREYQNNLELQIRLPCFIHYNRPDSTTHFDGPVPSQKLCYLCNKNIYTHVC